MLACIGIYVRILWYVYIFVPLTGQLLSDLSVATSDPKVERSQHPTSSASPATHTEGACQLYKPWRKHIGVVHCCCFGVRIWLLWFDFFFLSHLVTTSLNLENLDKTVELRTWHPNRDPAPSSGCHPWFFHQPPSASIIYQNLSPWLGPQPNRNSGPHTNPNAASLKEWEHRVVAWQAAAPRRSRHFSQDCPPPHPRPFAG